MTFLFGFFNGDDNENSKKNSSSCKNGKYRSLGMESLESRELLSATSFDYDIEQFSTSAIYSEITPKNTATPTQIEFTDHEILENGSIDLAWTNFGDNFEYTLIWNGQVIYAGTETSFNHIGATASNTYYVNAKNTQTLQTYTSEPLRLGEAFNPTLSISYENGKTTLSWIDQSIGQPGVNFSYMITRDGVTITPYLYGTSYVDEPAAGQAYEYVLYVYNQSTKKWVHSEPVAAGVLAAPTEVHAEEVGRTEFTLVWTPPANTTGASGYLVEMYDAEQGVWVPINTIVPIGTNEVTFTGMQENTEYRFRISTVSNQETVGSSITVEGSVTTKSPIPMPTEFQATATTDSQITVTWTAPEDTSEIFSYVIGWSVDGVNWEYTTVSATTEKTYSATLTGLAADTMYRLSIRSVSEDGLVYSNTALATARTTLMAPTNFRVDSINQDQAVLKWVLPTTLPTGTGAGYQITWKDNKGSSGNFTLAPNVSEYTFIFAAFNGATENATYTFTITTVAGSPSIASTTLTVSASTPRAVLDPPQDFTVVANDNGNGAKLSWTASTDSENVLGYEIQYIGPGGNWNNPDTIKTITVDDRTTTEKTIDYLPPGTYEFRIFSTGADDTAPNGYESASLTIWADRPTGLNVTATTTNTLTLEWTKPASETGVFGYLIEYIGPNGSWTDPSTIKINNTAETSTVLTDLSANTTYQFRIYSVDASGNIVSKFDATPSATTALDVPVGLGVVPETITDSGLTLTWQRPNNANDVTGYSIQYREKGTQDWSTAIVTGVTTLTKAIDGLKAGKTYEFQIASTGTGVTSDFSAVFECTLLVAAPKIESVTADSPTQVTVTWSAPTEATGIEKYQVERWNGSGWDIVATTDNNTTFTATIVTGMQPNGEYRFRVSSIDAENKTIASANEKSVVMPLHDPTDAVATADSWHTVNLEWLAPSPATGVTGYEVRWSTNENLDEADWESTTVTGTFTTISGLKGETTYYFRVYAINSDNDNRSLGYVTASVETPETVLDAPTNLSVKDQTSSTLTLSWTPSEGANGYEITYKIKGAASGTTITVTGGASSEYVLGDVANETLMQATQYEIEIRAIGTKGVSASDSIAFDLKQTNTLPVAPADLTVTNVTANTATLNWKWEGQTYPITSFTIEVYNSSTGKWDVVYVMENLPISGSDYSYDLKGLKAGSDYQYRVYATGQNSTSENTVISKYAFADAHTKISGPTYLLEKTDTATETSVTLTWTPPTGDYTGYVLQYRAPGSIDWQTVDTNNIEWNGNEATIKNLDWGTYYEFQIYAVNGTVESAPSNFIKVNTLSHKIDPPTIVSAVGGETTIELAWLVPDDGLATGYYIYWTEFTNSWYDDNTAKHDVITNGTTTTYTITGLTSGTAYKVWIVSTIEFGDPSEVHPKIWSEEVPFLTDDTKTIVAAPTDFKAADVNVTDVLLTWTDGGKTGLEHYLVEMSTNGTDWTTAGRIAHGVGECLVAGLTPNAKYHFRITAIGASQSVTLGGKIENSATTTLDPITTRLDGPSKLTAAGAWDRVTLNWTNGVKTDVDYYVIEYKLDNGKNWENDTVWTQKITSLNRTTIGITTNIASGNNYVFRIYAVSEAADGTLTKSEISNEAKATTPQRKLDKPTVVGATAGINTINLEWQAVDGATGYVIYLSDGTTNRTETIDSGTATTATLSVSSGTTYLVQIQAIAGSAESSDWATFTTGTTTGVAAPTNLVTTEVTATTITLNWTAGDLTGVQDYRIRVRVNGTGDWKLVDTVDKDKTSYEVTGLDPNTSYEFRIRAWSTGGQEYSSDWSAPSAAVTTKLYGPTNFNVDTTATDHESVTLTWNAATKTTGITTYVVEYTTDKDDWSNPKKEDFDITTNTTGGTVAGLTANTQYWFRIVAVGANGERSVESDAVSETTAFKTLDAPTVTVTREGLIDAKLDWIAVTGAIGYEIQWREVGGVWNTPQDIGNTTGYSISGLAPGKTYECQVRSISNGTDGYPGTSDWTTVIVTTHVYTPTNLAVVTEQTTANSVTLEWTIPKSDGVTGYEAWYKADGDAGWTKVANFVGTEANGKVQGKVTGLKSNTQYDFKIKALGGTDSGEIITTSLTTTKPTAPTGLDVDYSETAWDKITVTWSTDSIDVNVSNLTLYVSTWNSQTNEYELSSFYHIDSTDQAFADGKFDADNLEPGTKYRFHLVAESNISGQESGASNYAYDETTPTKCAKPTSLAIGATTVNSVALEWDDMTDKYTTGFEIWVNGTLHETVLLEDLDDSVANKWGHLVTGLNAGTDYSFVVYAVNNTNQANKSVASNSDSATTDLAAPTALLVVSGSQSVKLTWTEPAVDQRTGIEGYWCYIYDDTGVTLIAKKFVTTNECTFDESDTYDVLNKLQSNTGYVVQIKSGTADENNLSAELEDNFKTGLATAAIDTEVQTNVKQVTITLDPPAADSDIVDYEVTWYNNNTGKTAKGYANASNGWKVALSGLLNGQDNEITIVSRGDGGAKSDALKVQIPCAVAAPGTVTVTETEVDSVTIQWADPESMDSITGFRITICDGNGTPIISRTPIVVNNPDEREWTITNLSPNMTYTFKVESIGNAANNFEDSFKSSNVKAKTEKQEMTVNNLLATVTDYETGTVLLTWDAATILNERNGIASFRIQYSLDGGKTWHATGAAADVPVGIGANEIDPSDPSWTFTGLPVGQEIVFRIRANAASSSDYVNSDWLDFTTLKTFSGVTIVAANSNGTVVNNSWAALKFTWDGYGNSFGHYFVEYTFGEDADGNPDWNAGDSSTVTAAEFVLKNSNNDVPWIYGGNVWFRVSVIAANGDSLVVTETVMKHNVQKVPLDRVGVGGVTVDAKDNESITVSWVDGNLSGSKAPYVTGYLVQYRVNGTTQWLDADTVFLTNLDPNTYKLENLAPATSYDIQIIVIGDDDYSVRSTGRSVTDSTTTTP